MKYDVHSVEAYLKAMPKERSIAINQMRAIFQSHLPKGFEEMYLYNMITYVVPLSTYPKGYHCTPDTPLSFISIASQKQTINVYHSGLYSDKKLYQWFLDSYKHIFNKKPNMGKSCIRFKEINSDVLALLKELATKMTVNQYIDIYEHRLDGTYNG